MEHSEEKLSVTLFGGCSLSYGDCRISSQTIRSKRIWTLIEYLIMVRINKAKELLARSDYKIYEVAELVGYKTSQYFSQVFRKVCGSNPIDWQRGETNK